MSDADTFPNDPALDVLKGFGSRAASVGRAFGFLILWLLFLMVFSSFCALALGLKAQTLPDGRQVIPGMGSDPTVSAVFEAASLLGALLATAIICTRGGLSARDVGFRLDGVGRSLAIGAGLGLSLLTTVVLVTIGLGGIRLAPFDLHGLEAPLWFVGFAVLFGLVALTEELTIRGPLLTLFGRAFGFWPGKLRFPAARSTPAKRRSASPMSFWWDWRWPGPGGAPGLCGSPSVFTRRGTSRRVICSAFRIAGPL